METRLSSPNLELSELNDEALAALTQLMRNGERKPADVARAIKELGIDPAKADPLRA